jgi:RNA-directed DNA polymerase
MSRLARDTPRQAWRGISGPLAQRAGLQRERDRIRELTRRSRLLLTVEVVVEDLNRFLRSWADYFRYGHSAIRFGNRS